MKKYILILLFLFVLFQKATAQKEQKIASEIENLLLSDLNGKEIKDSIALYTFSIQIDIKKVKNKTYTAVSCNHPIAHQIFNNIKVLLNLDYAVFVQKAKNRIINIPVAYLVANYTNAGLKEKYISIKELQNNIYKLFNYSANDSAYKNDNYIYIKPIIITVDKTVYD
jgi:hypothetical protein